MKDKIKIGFLLIFCLGLCFVIQYYSSFAFDFIILALSLFSVMEFRRLQLKFGSPSFVYAPEIGTFLIFVGVFVSALCGLGAIYILLITLAIILIFYFAIFMGSYFLTKKDIEKDAFRVSTGMSIKRFAMFKSENTINALLYPTMMLYFLYFINHIAEIGLGNFNTNTSGAAMGLFGLILAFALSTFTDIFSMLFGTLIKGKKLCPKISPKKTISGAIFGLIGSMIGAVAVYFIFLAIYPVVFSKVFFWQFIVLGFVGGLVAEGGDLFESYLKRKANVKDSGQFFRSHGGVLDRLDSIIFVAPYAFICLLFLFG